jgi:hypothetical protein
MRSGKMERHKNKLQQENERQENGRSRKHYKQGNEKQEDGGTQALSIFCYKSPGFATKAQ